MGWFFQSFPDSHGFVFAAFILITSTNPKKCLGVDKFALFRIMPVNKASSLVNEPAFVFLTTFSLIQNNFTKYQSWVSQYVSCLKVSYDNVSNSLWNIEHVTKLLIMEHSSQTLLSKGFSVSFSDSNAHAPVERLHHKK